MNAKSLYQSPSTRICWSLHKKLEEATSLTESDLSSSKLTPSQLKIRGQNRKKLHTPEEIAKAFHYENGNLYYKRAQGIRPITGSIRPNGYVQVTLKRQQYLAHRIVWCLHNSSWPKEQIDHINGIRYDNRIENLREVTVRENLTFKRKLYKTNTSGVPSVHWCKRVLRWVVKLPVSGEYIGKYKNIESAIRAQRRDQIISEIL